MDRPISARREHSAVVEHCESCNPVGLLVERWKSVRELPGIYAVSNYGRVRRIGAAPGAKVGHELSTQSDKRGYVYVHLWNAQHRIRRGVHQLVADAFIGPRPEGKEVNHRDFAPSHNHVWNLEWMTHAENIQDAARNGRMRHPEQCLCVVCKLRGTALSPSERRARNAELARGYRQRERGLEKFGCHCGDSFATSAGLSVHRGHRGHASP